MIKKSITKITFLLFALVQLANANQWQQLPGPFGCTVSNLATANNNILISTQYNQVYGGIFRSTNNGSSWTEVTSNLPSKDIQSIISVGNTFYASLDSTIYMTTDYGNTWSLFATFPLGSIASRLGYLNNDIFVSIYYGVGNSECFVSPNATGTFVTTGIVTGINNTINAISSLPGKICVAAGSEIYISTDGVNFTVKSGNIPFSSTVNAVGGMGDSLYCSANNSPYYTTDGGNLWMPATQGLPGNTYIQSYTMQGNLVYAATLTGGVYSTVRGTNNWIQVGTGIPYNTALTKLAFNGNSLLVGGYSGIFVAATPGATWVLSNSGIKRANIRTIYADGFTILAAVDGYTGLYISTNGGTTWAPTDLVNTHIVNKIIKAGNEYYALSVFMGVYKSSNGSVWTSVNNGLSGNSIYDLAVSGNRILLATSGGVYATSNGGALWTNSSSGLPVSTSMGSLAVDGLNVYLSQSNQGVYRSKDGGTTWQIANNGINLSYAPFRTIIANSECVILQSDYGIYRSLNNGDSWTLQFSNNLPYAYGFAFSNKNLIAAGSSSAAVSDDNGKSWHDWNEGFAPLANYLQSICVSGYNVYAGTQGYSIWNRNVLPELFTNNITGTPFCAGNSVTINFNSTTTFNPGNKFIVQLSDSNGTFSNPLKIDSLVSAIPSAITVTLPDTIAQGSGYRIRVVSTDPYVINADNGFDFSIKAKPAITLQPANQQTCEGLGSGFYCGAKGTNITYQWQCEFGTGSYSNLTNNATYQNVNDNLLLIVSTTISMSGYKYRCVVSGDCAPSVTSNFGILVVNSLQVILSNPSDSVICSGDNASFFVTATSSNYQWQVDNGSGFFFDLQNTPPYSGVTTSTLSITGATVNLDGNKYRCQISDCFNSDSALLTVNGSPIFNGSVSSQFVCVNSMAIFSAPVSGANINYQWQENTGGGFVDIINGGNYSGAKSADLVIDNISLTQNGFLYQCIITGVCAPFTFTTNAASIIINNTPPIIAQQPVNITVCENAKAKFNCLPAGPVSSYQWQMKTPGGNWQYLTNIPPFSGVNNDTLLVDTSAISLSGNKFRCQLDNCTYSDSASLTVTNFPVVTQTSLGIVCENGGPISLSGGSPSGGSYFGNTVYNNIFYPAQSGAGTFTISYLYTASGGCSASASQDITVVFCTALSDNENKNSINIYPNPAQDLLHIKLNEERNENSLVVIFDVMGKQIFSDSQSSADLLNGINISQLPSGLYFISVKNSSQQFSGKFLKQ